MRYRRQNGFARRLINDDEFKVKLRGITNKFSQLQLIGITNLLSIEINGDDEAI